MTTFTTDSSATTVWLQNTDFTTQGKRTKLRWNEEAVKSFENLKTSFTTAPILKHPDPELLFVAEDDASDCGIGVVLLQHHGSPGKLYPCAAFSRKLNAAQRNYDVGNKELLSMKALLKEWHHWLEGAVHPFQIITYHNNLKYIKAAKRMNSRQAWWSLFFFCFNFTVTNPPGNKNHKADALSHKYDPEQINHPIVTILPPSVVIAQIIGAFNKCNKMTHHHQNALWTDNLSLKLYAIELCSGPTPH